MAKGTKSSKGDDALQAWAKAPKPTRCHICRELPEVKPVIRSYLQMRVDRETVRTYADLQRFLIESHGAEGLGYDALRNHIQKCEPELYGQIAG